MTTVEKTGEGELTARLAGDIDHHSVGEMRDIIDDAVDRDRPCLLVLDFGAVTFMDSSGIGLVMGRYKRMDGIGGKLKITNVPPQMRKVMRISGIDRLATIDNKGGTSK